MTNNIVQLAARNGPMLEPLLESGVKERILLYLHTHGESYPREIARDLGLYVNAVQYQLLKLEKGGVLYSKLRGKVRLFGMNPRYPFKNELAAILEKALLFVRDEERRELFRPRLRPRRTGKPLS
jgi:DNA-binding transcriptional ArsR family regulator